MRSRLIDARFNGRCRCCNRSVLKGESVYFAKHYGIRCEACGPHTDQDAPIPSKRSRKSQRAAQPVAQPAPQPDSPDVLAGPIEPARYTGFVPMYTPASLRCVAEFGPDRVARLCWSSASELVEDAFADYAQADDTVSYLRSVHRHHAGDTWANGHDEKSLRATLSAPRAELIEAIEQMRQQLIGDVNLPTAPRRKVRRGLDWGDELDADRWLHRDPNAWERNTREQQTRRTVTIGVNLTVHWKQEPEELLWRGAAACALADLLTERGGNVRVIGFSVGESCSDKVSKLVSTLELKAPDMPLDVSSLATAVCDVGFFRMVVMPAEFRHLPGKVSRGLGMRGEQYLPGPDRMGLDYLVESRVTGREAAEDWLRSQINQELEVEHV